MDTQADQVQSNQIGTLAEKSLHAALKAWYGRDGDRVEAVVDGFVVDLVRDDQLIEIQTGSFHPLRRKLGRLLDHHPIHVVHPIAAEKWLLWRDADGRITRRRKSPRRGRLEEIFTQLVYIPHLIEHPHLTIEVLLTQIEEVRQMKKPRARRRKNWILQDRILLAVTNRQLIAGVADLIDLLPASIAQPFTNRELSIALACPRRLAEKATYTLRRCDGLNVVGKRGGANLYALAQKPRPGRIHED